MRNMEGENAVPTQPWGIVCGSCLILPQPGRRTLQFKTDPRCMSRTWLLPNCDLRGRDFCRICRGGLIVSSVASAKGASVTIRREGPGASQFRLIVVRADTVTYSGAGTPPGSCSERRLNFTMLTLCPCCGHSGGIPGEHAGDLEQDSDTFQVLSCVNFLAYIFNKTNKTSLKFCFDAGLTASSATKGCWLRPRSKQEEANSHTTRDRNLQHA